MSGPSIQGSIIIRTDSVQQAIAKVTALKSSVEKFSQSATGSTQGVSEAIGRTVQAYAALSKEVSQGEKIGQRQLNLIAKAANKFAQYEAAVRSSNISQGQQTELLTRAAAQLQGYESAVMKGATGGQRLANINTELAVSYSQLQRDLSATNAAAKEEAKVKADAQRVTEANANALSRSNIQYERTVAAVRRASLESSNEATVVREVEQAHRQLQSVLQNSSTTRQQAAAAQRQFNEVMARANITAQTGQMRAASEATMAWRSEMRNLSTSVVVALGPLSGIASRLTALTTLFSRNAVEMATVFTALTGFSVLLARASSVGQEAEQQIFRLNAQLENLGHNAQTTATELEYMAHGVAAATMTSAKEVRQASGVLLEFGGIARNQFQDVLLAAQGMSTVFGGTLSQNARRLGRAIEDPVSGLTRLEQQGVILDDATKDQIRTLVNQGKQYEATAVLLGQLTSLQQAAKGETQGLAGAYDTLSGNLDVLFQELFIGSGAIEAAAANISQMAEAVREFTQSDFAQVLGRVFKAIMELSGRGLTFIIENMDKFAAVVAAVSFSILPKLIVSLFAASGALGAKLRSTLAATAALLRFQSATTGATLTTKAFTIALLANPFVRAATALAGLVGTIWAYRRAVDAVNSGTTLAGSIETQIERIIAANLSLTREQAELYRQQSQTLKEAAQEQENSLDLVSGKYEELRGELRSTMGVLERFSRGGSVVDSWVDQLARSGTLMGETRRQFNQLTEDQQKIVMRMVEQRKAVIQYNKAIEETKARTDELGETIKAATGADAVTDLATQMERLAKNAREIELEIFSDRNQLNQLQEARQRILAMIETTKELAEAGKDTSAEYAVLKETLEEVESRMKAVSEVEMSREAQRLVDRAKEAVVELQKMGEIMSRGGDTDGLIASRYEVEALVREMQDLEEVELKAIAEQLGSEADIHSIAVAMVATTRAIQQLADEMDRIKKLEQDDDAAVQRAKQTMEMIRALDDEYAERQKILAVNSDLALLEARGLINAEQRNRLMDEYIESLDETDEKWGDIANRFNSFVYSTPDAFATMLGSFMDTLEQMGVAINSKMGETVLATAMMMDQGMELMQAAGRQGSTFYKRMAQTQAMIAGAMSVLNVFADPTLPTMAKFGMAALVGATVGAQIAQIEAANFATGGFVSGPGTSTSDSIPAMLSNGEYVMRAAAVRALGVGTLDALNEGRTVPFATGGVVGVPMGGGSYGGDINFQVIDQTSGKHQYEQREEMTSDGQRNIILTIRDVVKQGVMDGDFDRELGGRYSLKPAGRRV